MAASARVALVTGGAQGLGRAIAERLAREGMTIVLGDTQEEQARSTARAIEAAGSRCVAIPLDVADEQSVANIYEETQRRFGRLDALVNNAGVSGLRISVEEMPLSDWDRTLRVNLTGAFLMSRGAVALMRRLNWGRIVNICSQAARSRTGIGKANYAASKAGMLGLARVLADEVGRYGITVNSVCPSRTRTALTMANAATDRGYFDQAVALTAVGRLAEPRDTAGVVAFLCSDEASFLTGTVIDVTGGAFMP